MTDIRPALCAALNEHERLHPETDPVTGHRTAPLYRLPTPEEALLERAIIESLVKQQKIVPGAGKGIIRA